MEKRARDACPQSLDIGIPNRDALCEVVSHPDARRPFFRVGQEGFVAAYRDRIDDELIRRCGRNTVS